MRLLPYSMGPKNAEWSTDRSQHYSRQEFESLRYTSGWVAYGVSLDRKANFGRRLPKNSLNSFSKVNQNIIC